MPLGTNKGFSILIVTVVTEPLIGKVLGGNTGIQHVYDILYILYDNCLVLQYVFLQY